MRLSNLFENVEQGAGRKASALSLFEGWETQQAIEWVADALISAFAIKGARVLRDRIASNIAESYDPDDMGGVTFQEAFPKVQPGTPPKLAAFIRDMRKRWLVLRYTSYRGPLGTYSGWYNGGGSSRQPEIMIHLERGKFDPLVDLAKQGRLKSTDVHHAIRPTRLTVIHEVTHAYDDWVSKGRYDDNKRSVAARDARIAYIVRPTDAERAKRSNALYMNAPEEVNARYTQTVAKLERDRLRLPWRDYLSNFQYEMLGWRKLPAQVKDRLTRRLAAHWQQGRPVLDLGLREAVKRAQTRIREATGLTDFWLSVSPESKAMSISNFGTRSRKLAVEVLRALSVFADVKGLTLAAPLPPGPDVSAMGFINQRSGSHDYSLPLGTRIYRRPRPRIKAG